MTGHIILCEPQCWGFEHVRFNAALLDTVLLAYPDLPVLFAGEREHIESVRQTLAKHDARSLQRVEWQVTSIPPRDLGGRPRLAEEWGQFRSILGFTLSREARLLILCSVTNTGLLALKRSLFQLGWGIPTVAVLHSILGSVLERQARRPWYWVLGLRQVLRLPQPRGLRYIALGEPIFRCLAEVLPSVAVHFSVMDQPYFWELHAGSLEEPVPDQVCFGHVGVANREKGFHGFGRIAEEAAKQRLNARFVLAGFVNTRDRFSAADSYIEGAGLVPLTQEEYSHRVSSLTYAVGMAEPLHYRLVASASFLDALSFVKPGIYLRNPYIAYYFEQMGDIGYLCDSCEQVQSTVFSLAKSFPTERYWQQRMNILKGRRLFEPPALAPRISHIGSLVERKELSGAY